MPYEKAPSSTRTEILDAKTLSAQDKVKRLLEVFDTGKDKEKNKERKQNFNNLLKQYYEISVSERARRISESELETSDKEKAAIHNKIMDIIRNISLSQGITKDQEMLTEYLGRDRKRVADMIWDYFTHANTPFKTTDSVDHTLLHQARRGEGWFTSPPGKEDD